MAEDEMEAAEGRRQDGKDFLEDDYTDQRMREAENHGMADKYETYPAYDPYAEYKSEIRSLDK